MGNLKTGRVCFYRPKRKRVRVFTSADVKRITKYAIDDGADPRDLLVGVASAAGLGYLLCASSKAVNSALTIASLLTKIGGALAVTKIIEFLLSLVTSGLIKKLPLLRRYAAVILLIAGTAEGILKATKDLFDSAEIITSSAEAINDLCERGKALAVDSLGL